MYIGDCNKSPIYRRKCQPLHPNKVEIKSPTILWPPVGTNNHQAIICSYLLNFLSSCIMVWSLLHYHLPLHHIISMGSIFMPWTNSHLYKSYRSMSEDDLASVRITVSFSFWLNLSPYIIVPILYFRWLSNHYLSSDRHRPLWMGKNLPYPYHHWQLHLHAFNNASTCT